MNTLTDFSIETYKPDDNLACNQLERLCSQGKDVRLYMDRSVFHARASQFAESKIQVVKQKSEPKIIGVLSTAKRQAIVCGSKMQLAYMFDFRVHPAYRGRRIGRALLEAAIDSARKMGVEAIYAEEIAGNKNPVRERFLRDFAGYEYLTLPVFKHFEDKGEALSECEMQENHQLALKYNGPFDFHYPDPNDLKSSRGFVRSLRNNSGGCSIWDMSDVYTHVVTRVPRAYPFIRYLLKVYPGSLRKLPVPRPGERFREWNVFDVWAASGNDAQNLARHVNNLARENNINFMNYLLSTTFPHTRAIRSLVGNLFSKEIPVRLIEIAGKTLPNVKNVCPDVRD